MEGGEEACPDARLVEGEEGDEDDEDGAEGWGWG